MRHYVSLLHTYIDKVALAEAGQRIQRFIESGASHQVIAANIDFLRLAQNDPSFRQLINTSDLAVADGMPLVWASRFLHDPLPQRISGVELINECARLSSIYGYRIFLLGSAAGVAQEAAAVLQAHHSHVNIVGTYTPPLLPWTSEQEDAVISLIQQARPDILFIAFGAPLQERWIRANMQRLGVPVCMGVGGAFDMLAGRVRRAPVWMQQNGLEWFYRLAQEPGRLWKRYFVHDLPVFLRLMRQCWFDSRGQTTVVQQEDPIIRDEEMVRKIAVLDGRIGSTRLSEGPARTEQHVS